MIDDDVKVVVFSMFAFTGIPRIDWSAVLTFELDMAIGILNGIRERSREISPVPNDRYLICPSDFVRKNILSEVNTEMLCDWLGRGMLAAKNFKDMERCIEISVEATTISEEPLELSIRYFDRDLEKVVVKRVEYHPWTWINPWGWYKLRKDGKDYEFLEDINEGEEDEPPEEYEEEEIEEELIPIDKELLTLNIFEFARKL